MIVNTIFQLKCNFSNGFPLFQYQKNVRIECSLLDFIRMDLLECLCRRIEWISKLE